MTRMTLFARFAAGGLLPLFFLVASVCAAESMKTESFDRDPGWDGHNNRIAQERPPVTVHQDFGFSATSHAGGKEGEIGGHISDAVEAAYYAKVIPQATFDTPLKASGTLASSDGTYQLLLGFFNAGTTKEWRTPNTIVIRLNGRGSHFYAYVEYGTQKWRAGGDNPKPFGPVDPVTGKRGKEEFTSGGKVHRWSLTYDPHANNGAGVVTATIDGTTAICNLDPGHKADGATFDRFGILNVMKSAKEGGDVFFDDITINGKAESFDADPQWEGKNNRKAWESRVVRPWFDFGFSPATRFAGGKGDGELGGVVFRGDCRNANTMAFYGDRIGPLNFDKPFKASGKMALRGVSDSSASIGFFNSTKSIEVSERQDSGAPKCFVGLGIEGPSSEGFYVSPGYRGDGDHQGSNSRDANPLRIYPDGASHDWSLEYDPAAAAGKGRVTVTLDGRSVGVDLAEGHKAAGATFDRFGIVTCWIDGHSQNVYFDDITYTVSQ